MPLLRKELVEIHLAQLYGDPSHILLQKLTKLILYQIPTGGNHNWVEVWFGPWLLSFCPSLPAAHDALRLEDWRWLAFLRCPEPGSTGWTDLPDTDRAWHSAWYDASWTEMVEQQLRPYSETLRGLVDLPRLAMSPTNVNKHQ